jgi:hypothetical protein
MFWWRLFDLRLAQNADGGFLFEKPPEKWGREQYIREYGVLPLCHDDEEY